MWICACLYVRMRLYGCRERVGVWGRREDEEWERRTRYRYLIRLSTQIPIWNSVKKKLFMAKLQIFSQALTFRSWNCSASVMPPDMDRKQFSKDTLNIEKEISSYVHGLNSALKFLSNLKRNPPPPLPPSPFPQMERFWKKSLSKLAFKHTKNEQLFEASLL